MVLVFLSLCKMAVTGIAPLPSPLLTASSMCPPRLPSMLGSKGRVCGRARNEMIQENVDPLARCCSFQVVVVIGYADEVG